MFKSLRHFEFNFVYGVRVPSNFTNLHVAVHLREGVLDWFAGLRMVTKKLKTDRRRWEHLFSLDRKSWGIVTLENFYLCG